MKAGMVPWWLDAWIEHTRHEQAAFAISLRAAVARESGGGGGAAVAAAAAGAVGVSPPLPSRQAPVAASAAAAAGAPNYRLLRSLLKAGAAQALAEAEVAQEAAAKGRVVGGSVQRFAKMEE